MSWCTQSNSFKTKRRLFLLVLTETHQGNELDVKSNHGRCKEAHHGSHWLAGEVKHTMYLWTTKAQHNTCDTGNVSCTTLTWKNLYRAIAGALFSSLAYSTPMMEYICIGSIRCAPKESTLVNIIAPTMVISTVYCIRPEQAYRDVVSLKWIVSTRLHYFSSGYNLFDKCANQTISLTNAGLWTSKKWCPSILTA